MKDLTHLKSLTEDEYNQLLRQAVAVIEASRIQIAKQLNTVAMSSYWEIGKLLEEKKLDSKRTNKNQSVFCKKSVKVVPLQAKV